MFFAFGDYGQKPNVIEEKDVEEQLPFDVFEFVKTINLSDYALNEDELQLSTYDPDSLMGDQEAIYQMLRNSLAQNNELMKKAEDRINHMDDDITHYKSFILTDEKFNSKIKDNKFLIPKGSEDSAEELSDSSKLYLTEVEIEEKIKNNELKTREKMAMLQARKGNVSNQNYRKTLDNVVYNGYDENELTDFPGFLEAPQLLNGLSVQLGFKPSFLKYWTPIIRSDASCAIVLDSFWWFFLKCFSKDENVESDAYKYFCRISENFSRLLLTVHSSIRDRFFGSYADFLSQAIYLAFYRIFPDSRLHFNDSFKQEICNVIGEWILGIRPIPESYLNWVINEDININRNTDTKVSTKSEILQKIGNLEKILNNLGEPSVRFSDQIGKDKLDGLNRNNSMDEFETFYAKSTLPSHVVGEGSVIEKSSFNLLGQSVLISHYLKIHNLQDSEDRGQKITRTEIVSQPPRTAPTYRDLIHETLQRAKSMGDDFKKNSKINEDEIRRIERNRKKLNDEINHIKRSSSLKIHKHNTGKEAHNRSMSSDSARI